MRGDNGCQEAKEASRKGSPPRAWGQQSYGPNLCPDHQDHPHVRGDNFLICQRVGVHKGSPPRAWGQPMGPVAGRGAGRITPTCVGTTHWHPPGYPAVKDHPHVRGDNHYCVRNGAGIHRITPTCVGTTISLPICKNLAIGSPPRAWGQHIPAHLQKLGDRITPTCVGTTGEGPGIDIANKDHPHVRGDNVPESPVGIAVRGSPPRAWGQRCGISARRPMCQDHPHVRGDNVVNGILTAIPIGSPPRAWGQPWRERFRYLHRGITPTCVGTTTAPAAYRPRTSDHPHVRGDNIAA